MRFQKILITYCALVVFLMMFGESVLVGLVLRWWNLMHLEVTFLSIQGRSANEEDFAYYLAICLLEYMESEN